jgi:hypothetical protein
MSRAWKRLNASSWLPMTPSKPAPNCSHFTWPGS